MVGMHSTLKLHYQPKGAPLAYNLFIHQAGMWFTLYRSTLGQNFFGGGLCVLINFIGAFLICIMISTSFVPVHNMS